MKREPTIQDVLESISVFSTHLDSRLDKMDNRFDRLEKDVSVLKQDVAVLKNDMSVMKGDMRTVQGTMVTKDYMEGRLAALAHISRAAPAFRYAVTSSRAFARIGGENAWRDDAEMGFP